MLAETTRKLREEVEAWRSGGEPSAPPKSDQKPFTPFVRPVPFIPKPAGKFAVPAQDSATKAELPKYPALHLLERGTGLDALRDAADPMSDTESEVLSDSESSGWQRRRTNKGFPGNQMYKSQLNSFQTGYTTGMPKWTPYERKLKPSKWKYKPY